MFLNVLVLILVFILLVGCTKDNISNESDEIETAIEELRAYEELGVDAEYMAISYDLLTKPGNMKAGDKIYLDGQLDPDLIRVFDIELGIYKEFLRVGPNESILLHFRDREFFSASQASNFNFDKIDRIRGKEAKYYLEYLWDMESGKPVCLVDKVEIDNEVYKRDYFGGDSNVVGSIDNPGKIGMSLVYEEYDGSLELELLEVIKGEEAKRVLEGFEKSNRILIEHKSVIMAKFYCYNSGEPFDISHYNFQYANQSLTADYRSPYMKGIKNELNFTVFSEKDGEGWIIFEIDSEDTKGYAVFNKELWFELF